MEDKEWVHTKRYLLAWNLQDKTSIFSLADYRIGPIASRPQ